MLFEKTYAGKCVLVTGDTGFKGSWLAIWLNHLGANVIGYALEPKTKMDNYVICGLDKKITHIDADIRDYESLENVFKKYEPEIVFHLAAQALVLESYASPLETYSSNVMGTVNVLEAIRETKLVKAAVIITTDKCYENKNCLYGYRETDRLGGEDPYSASKAACEIVIASYTKSFFSALGTANIASARAGNVIGGGDWSENRIIPDIMRAIENNKPVKIRNPQSTRPWQHVLEPLSGYLMLGIGLLKDKVKYQGSWNFGPSYKNIISVEKIVEVIINKMGKGSIELNPLSNQPYESSMLSLDITKAINQLNWEPKLDFLELVQLTIDEYKVYDWLADEIFQQRLNHIDYYSSK